MNPCDFVTGVRDTSVNLGELMSPTSATSSSSRLAACALVLLSHLTLCQQTANCESQLPDSCADDAGSNSTIFSQLKASRLLPRELTTAQRLTLIEDDIAVLEALAETRPSTEVFVLLADRYSGKAFCFPRDSATSTEYREYNCRAAEVLLRARTMTRDPATQNGLLSMAGYRFSLGGNWEKAKQCYQELADSRN